MSNGLSYFVEDELNRLRHDDSFHDFGKIKEEYFNKFSEEVSNFDVDQFEMYEDVTSMDQYIEKSNEKEVKPFEDYENEPKLFLPTPEPMPMIMPSQDSFK